MSDRPLFQNTDEQEAAYGAEPGPEAAIEDQGGGDNDSSYMADDTGTGGTALPLPGPGASGALNNVGQLSSGPIVGAVNDDDEDDA